MNPAKRAIAGVCAAVIWAGAPAAAQTGAPGGEWRTYGGDLGNTRYSALDQITAENFSDLEIAWRFKTDFLGPRPEFRFESTPLMANGVLYSTAGSRRMVVALDAATGEMLWVWRLDEGARGGRRAAPALRTRAGVLDRRQRGADCLRLPRLPPDRPRRGDRPPRSGIRRGRHRRPEAEPRPGDRPGDGRDRPACHAGRRRRRGDRGRRAPHGRQPPQPRKREGGTSAATTCGPASGCGSSTRSRGRASSGARRG